MPAPPSWVAGWGAVGAVGPYFDGHLTTYPGEAHMLSAEHHPDWITTLTAWAR